MLYFYEICDSLSDIIFMRQNKVQVWLPVVLSLTLVLGMFFGYKLRDNMGNYAPSFFHRSKKNPVQEILTLVQQKYVDTVNIDSLGEFAIQDVLQQLDPHSVYIPPADVDIMNEKMQGNFQGVGIEFGMLNDTLNVLYVMPNGPSAKAGLRTGDQIITANDSIISGKKRKADEIRRIFRGPKGTEVKGLLIRDGKKVQYQVVRNLIPSKSVDAAYLIEPAVAYIRLTKFSNTTYEEFMENLERLQKEGMQKLILDLRGNGGGMLDDAVQIADEFLDGNKEIVYTEGKSYPKQIYEARRPGLFEKGKLILLIDENSASASEVLAGALQDWDRATIIGRRSFGKGLVQEQFSLSDGSAVRLTVSRYFTPIGRSIQKPYSRTDRNKYEDELQNRFLNGELFHTDTSQHIGKPFKTKGGRIVYGGGGISPDIYVGLDSNASLPLNKRPMIRGVVNDAAYLYFLKNKNKISSFKSAPQLQEYLTANTETVSFLSTKLAKDSINLSVFTPAQQKSLTDNFISMISWYVWYNEGYARIKNSYDPIVQKALEEIKK